jgi:hypothetical protein
MARCFRGRQRRWVARDPAAAHRTCPGSIRPAASCAVGANDRARGRMASVRGRRASPGRRRGVGPGTASPGRRSARSALPRLPVARHARSAPSRAVCRWARVCPSGTRVRRSAACRWSPCGSAYDRGVRRSGRAGAVAQRRVAAGSAAMADGLLAAGAEAADGRARAGCRRGRRDARCDQHRGRTAPRGSPGWGDSCGGRCGVGPDRDRTAGAVGPSSARWCAARPTRAGASPSGWSAAGPRCCAALAAGRAGRCGP